MSSYTLIKNGRILDPVKKSDHTGDLWIHEGRFSAPPENRSAVEIQEVDASHLWVMPGLVDVHVHFREPGQTHKESIETGSMAALAGGVTSVVCMPNTSPPADNTGTIQLIKDSASRNSRIRIYPTGCITVGRKGEKLAPIGSLKKAGVVAITDDGDCVQDNEIMRRAMEYANMFDLPVMDHCQDMSLTRGAVMNEGEWSIRLGLKGWPAAAEDIIVARDVILSATTGAHIHLQHISSAYSVDVIKRAKVRDIRVTAEATPHHLALTDAGLHDYNTLYKMNPPLRTEEDRQALIRGVKEGLIDILATDHAPHTFEEKDQEFDLAPFGIVGLETFLSVSHQILHRENEMDLLDLISRMTCRPAQLFNLPGGTLNIGEPADLCLFDPNAVWEVNRQTLFGKSTNTPWLDQKLTGRVISTWVNGECLFNA